MLTIGDDIKYTLDGSDNIILITIYKIDSQTIVDGVQIYKRLFKQSYFVHGNLL